MDNIYISNYKFYIQDQVIELIEHPKNPDEIKLNEFILTKKQQNTDLLLIHTNKLSNKNNFRKFIKDYLYFTFIVNDKMSGFKLLDEPNLIKYIKFLTIFFKSIKVQTKNYNTLEIALLKSVLCNVKFNHFFDEIESIDLDESNIYIKNQNNPEFVRQACYNIHDIQLYMNLIIESNDIDIQMEKLKKRKHDLNREINFHILEEVGYNPNEDSLGTGIYNVLTDTDDYNNSIRHTEFLQYYEKEFVKDYFIVNAYGKLDKSVFEDL